MVAAGGNLGDIVVECTGGSTGSVFDQRNGEG